MSRIKTWAAYAALPVAVVVFAGLGLWLRKTSPAPGFNLPIVAGDGASEGDRVELAQLRGRVVLLDFWASWCGPCQQSIPILNRLAAEHEERGVTVLGVNVEPRLDPIAVRRAHRDFGAEFPSVHDHDQALETAYAITSLPTLVVIDRGGAIHEARAGVPDEERLRALLIELTAGDATEISE